MANTVKLKITVDDDGTLNIIGKNAKKAAAATEKLTGATDKASRSKNKYNKLEKGTAGLTSNSTKGFAKQASVVGGGLVPAYAVLAANVFALSAAFQFLKNAADVTILQKSQVDFATNTGVALQSVTARLREASDGLLGFSEAGQAAAIGLAKGFSPKQLEDLADGARRASTALGRDFSDSFDRLVRGASKAEPELLDELGITLRLEEATRRYADAIGVNRDELNATQRSQAVLIETQRQLNDLFGDIEAQSNPFVKLSKTFEDLVKVATQAVLPVFSGIADIISRSSSAAVAAFGLLAINIFKAAVPLDTIQQKFEDWTSSSSANLSKAEDDLKRYRSELDKTAAKIAEQRGLTASKGASDIIDQSKSKAGPKSLISKVAQGITLSPAQKGQLNKMLKEAEHQYTRHGRIVRGQFKGLNIDIVRGFNSAFNSMDRSSTTFFQKVQVQYRKLALTSKVVMAKVSKEATSAFITAGKAATVMGNAVDKAFRFAGILGLIIIVKEAITSLYNAPFTVLSNLAKAADGILNGIIMLFNFWAKSVLSIVDFIVNSISMGFQLAGRGVRLVFVGLFSAIDSTVNGAVSVVNDLIDASNLLLKTNFSTLTLKSELADTVAPADELNTSVSNLADSFTPFATNISIATAAVEKYGGALKEFEQGRKAVLASEEQLAALNKVSDAMQKDLLGITAGINAETDAAERGLAVAEGIASLGVTGQKKKIESSFGIPESATDSQKEEILKNQAAAIDNLRDSLAGASGVSEAYGSLIEKAFSYFSTSKDIKNLEDYEIAASNAVAMSAELKTQVSDIAPKLANSLGSGDVSSAIQSLIEMERSAESAAESFRLLGETESADAALNSFKNSVSIADENAKELRTTLEKLRKGINENAEAQLFANSISGAGGKARAASLKTEALALEIAVKEKAVLTDIGPVKKAIIQTEIDLAKAKLKVLEITERQIAADELGRRSNNASIEALIKGIDDMETRTASGMSPFQNMLLGLTDTFDALAEEFKKLGPEGELMSALSSGIANTLGSISAAMDVFATDSATTGQKIAAALAPVSAIINTIAEVQKAASAQKTRALEQEIEAERNRDGKSQESLSKISSLEKKKTAVARKAFEQEKKMKMAQVAISTAVGALQAYASAQVLGPPFGQIVGAMMAGLVIAMGAKQMAMIASTSFNGGASVSGAAPSSVSMGSRGSSVDLATSRSSSGEIAYMRGEEGSGGAENFRPAFAGYKNREEGTETPHPAFSGYKNRAEGGTTGLIVGEQGPELFVPQIPGRVVPNDDMIAGAPTNVSFNINAIDASGVEDMLVAQRGNIIGMIRQAANSYGQDFVEEVDTSTYTPSAGGVSRY